MTYRKLNVRTLPFASLHIAQIRSNGPTAWPPIFEQLIASSSGDAMNSAKIPACIIENNPGTLSRALIENTGKIAADGHFHFETMEAGLANFIVHIRNRYHHLGHRTLPVMIGGMLSITHNDIPYYIGLMARNIGANPLSTATRDLELDDDWKMLRFITAFCKIEHGDPQPKWLYGECWWTITQAAIAFEMANKWKPKS